MRAKLWPSVLLLLYRLIASGDAICNEARGGIFDPGVAIRGAEFDGLDKVGGYCKGVVMGL